MAPEQFNWIILESLHSFHFPLSLMISIITLSINYWYLPLFFFFLNSIRNIVASSCILVILFMHFSLLTPYIIAKDFDMLILPWHLQKSISYRLNIEGSCHFNCIYFYVHLKCKLFWKKTSSFWIHILQFVHLIKDLVHN